MKIICSKQALVKAINIVQKAIPSKTTMPILQCILINASGNQIRFTGNDTELGIETVVEGTIVEKGSIALDAKIFSELIRYSKDQDITIESDDTFCTYIVCGSSNDRIMGKDPEEFSAIPVIAKTNHVAISQFSLKDVIRQTIFSIAQNDSNPIMTGEYLEIHGDQLRLVSLDGHRISIRNLELSESHEDISAIIPGKTLNDVSRILSGDIDDIVDLYITRNHICFVFEDTVVVSRLIDGKYFRVNQMLSDDYETKVTVNRQEYMDYINHTMTYVREDDKKPIIINVDHDQLEISINSQIGSYRAELPAVMEGKPIKIGFNPKYLLDALKVIDDEEIDIYFMNAKSPCIIRDANKSYIYLVLPVNFV